MGGHPADRRPPAAARLCAYVGAFSGAIPGNAKAENVDEILMPHHHYLIVGGGMTADAAIQGDPRGGQRDGSIGLIGAEIERPYDRPPRSKGLWKGKTIDSIWRRTDGTHAALHLGRTVGRVDPAERQVRSSRAAGDRRPARSIPMTSSCSRRAAHAPSLPVRWRSGSYISARWRITSYSAC